MVKLKAFQALLPSMALCLGACQLPTNVALKRIDSLRAEQDNCLKGNIAQFDDRSSDPKQIGRFVAMSCTIQTEKLVQYAVPYATRREYSAFQDDAAARAASYVLSARDAAS
jgi:hypothetical protein